MLLLTFSHSDCFLHSSQVAGLTHCDQPAYEQTQRLSSGLFTGLEEF